MRLSRMLLCAALIASAQASAKIKCPLSKVQNLQVTENEIYIQLHGQPWHILAELTDEDADKKLARAEKAIRKDRYVELTFPNGNDDICMTTDLTVVVKKIKLKKNMDVSGG